MNREEIIAMAIKSHLVMYDYDHPSLEAFAALVASAEREFYMQLFLDPENQPTQFGTATQEYREQEVREAKQQERHEFKEHALAMARAAIIGAVKNEREACAKVCEEEYDTGLMMAPVAPNLAAAIRARGQA